VRQEINLYQPIFRRQRKVFTAKAMLQVAGAVVTGLALVYGYGLWRVQALESELTGLQNQQAAASRRLAELSKQLPGQERSKRLVSEVARLSRELEVRQKVEQLLTTGAYGNRRGFSEYLAGLARQHVEGLWLTGVDISEGEQDFDITGGALRPELVAVYVQRFSREPTFQGRRFQTLRMERPESDPGRVDFELRARVENR
jgi:Tfp pilus assembly protein PilN